MSQKFLLQLEITGDASKAAQALEQIKGKLNEMEGVTAKVAKGSEGAGSAISGLTGALGALGVAFSLGAAVAFAADLYNVSVAADRAQYSLNALTEGNADAYIEGIQQASLGTISSMDAMQASARALQLGVVGTADEMQQMTEVAVALGRIMGIDATQAINDMTTGLGRMSPLILDNLGIQVDMNSVNADAAVLMRENGELSLEQAQKQALLNQVLAVGATRIEQLGGVQEDALSQNEQLAASWADLKVQLGTFVSNAVGPAVVNLNNLLDQVKQITNAVETQKASNAATASSFEEYARALNEVGIVTDIQLGLMEDYNFQAGQALPFIDAMRAEYFQLRTEMLSLTEDTKAADDSLHGLSITELQAEAAANKLAEATSTYSDALNHTTDDQKLHQQAVTNIVSAYQSGQKTYEETALALQDIGATTDEVTKAQDDAEAAARAFEKALREQLRLQEDFAGIASDLAGSFDYVGDTIYETVEATSDFGKSLDSISSFDGGGKIEDLGDLHLDLAEKVLIANDALTTEAGLLNTMGFEATEAMEGVATVANAVGTLQLSMEDQQKIGEAYLDFLSATGREAMLAGDSYDTLREQFGLATEAQLIFEQGLRLINDAFATNQLTVEEGGQVFKDWATGAIGDIQALEDKLAELTSVPNPLADVVARMDETDQAFADLPATVGAAVEETVGAQAPLVEQITQINEDLSNIQQASAPAFEAVSKGSETAAPSVSIIRTELDKINAAFAAMPTAAKLAFDNMNNTASASVGDGNGLAMAAALINGIYDAWVYLLKNNYVKLKVDVEQNGAIPAGGGSGGGVPHASGGITMPGEVALVGEQGPELAVFPGGTRILPNSQTQSILRNGYARGGVIGGGSGGGMMIGGMSIVVNNPTSGTEVVDEIIREFERRGIELPKVS